MIDEMLQLKTYEPEQLLSFRVLLNSIDNEVECIHREIELLTNLEAVSKHLLKANKQTKRYQQSKTECAFIADDESIIIFCREDNFKVTCEIKGSPYEVNSVLEKLKGAFTEVGCMIQWYYNSDGERISIPLSSERCPVKEMYPNISTSLEEYWDSFLASKSNILILIGPPGTGKTSFIRGMLNHTKSSASVAYDSGTLEKDWFFARFLGGDDTFLILEDSDTFLKPREDGNTMMHRFLNIGDGLVSSPRKKIVFSTNLPSVRDIDSALVRPGRCFDVLHFDHLTHKQAENLAKKMNVGLTDNSDEYTIAEVFNQGKNFQAPSKFGF